MKEVINMYTEMSHELMSIHGFLLIQRNKVDVLRRQCFVSEGTLYRIQIMSSNRHQCSLSVNTTLITKTTALQTCRCFDGASLGNR
jgi:hypothetical protein